MRQFKTVKIPEKEQQILFKTTCDICGGEIKEERFEKKEVIIEKTEGVNYPEGGHAVVKSIDMCVGCFEMELIPWLESKGVVIEIIEYDY